MAETTAAQEQQQQQQQAPPQQEEGPRSAGTTKRKRHLGAVAATSAGAAGSGAPPAGVDVAALREAVDAHGGPAALLPAQAVEAPPPHRGSSAASSTPGDEQAPPPPPPAEDEQRRRLQAQLSKMEADKTEALALLASMQEALHGAHERAEASGARSTVEAQRLAALCTNGRSLSLSEWSALAPAQDNAVRDASGQLAAHAVTFKSQATSMGQTLEFTGGLWRRVEKIYTKAKLLNEALQESVDKMGTVQAERERDAECRAQAEKMVDKLASTLAREKCNAAKTEYAHQLRHELAAARERGETGDAAVARAREISLQRVSGDMLEQVDTINRANRRAGNRVTEWDCRDATEGAEEPVPKRARPQVPVFAPAA